MVIIIKHSLGERFSWREGMRTGSFFLLKTRVLFCETHCELCEHFRWAQRFRLPWRSWAKRWRTWPNPHLRMENASEVPQTREWTWSAWWRSSSSTPPSWLSVSGPAGGLGKLSRTRNRWEIISHWENVTDRERVNLINKWWPHWY